MSNKTDDLYNANLTLGSAKSSSGKENFPPKRILQQSKYISSPYDNLTQRPITANEHKMYEVVTTLCDDDRFCLYVVHETSLQLQVIFFFYLFFGFFKF